ncbi:MAG: apolipoprotein N-acyltransferase [Sumerlaeia bacterium]
MSETELSKKKRILGVFLRLFSPLIFLAKTLYFWLICLGFAVITFIAHPPVGIWPLSFFVYAILISYTLQKTPLQAFWVGLIAGTLTNTLLYMWLHVLSRFNPAIYLGIPALGLFQGLFLGVSLCVMQVCFVRMPRLPAAFAATGWFLLVEWIRANGPLGAPYAQAGHPLIEAYGIRQWAAVGGVLLLTCIVMLFNLSVACLWDRYRRNSWNRTATFKAIIAASALGFFFAVGAYFRTQLNAQLLNAPTLNVAILQTNISQELKFASYTETDPATRENLQKQLLDRVFEMLTELESIDPKPDLILTPESCFTIDDFDRNFPILLELQLSANRLGAPILVGSTDLTFRKADGSLTDIMEEAQILTSSEGFQYYDYEVSNALFLFKPQQVPNTPKAADYTKIHLMPFGETVPFFNIIPGFVENVVQVGMMLPGDKSQDALSIELRNKQVVKLGATICFEDMFPGLYFKYNREGANLLVNSTNNAWFDPGWGAEYHFAYSRFRAIEFQTSAVRATNTGISAVTLPTGNVMKRLPREQQLIDVIEIPYFTNATPTIYGRFGEWVAWLSLFISALSLYFLLRKKITCLK